MESSSSVSISEVKPSPVAPVALIPELPEPKPETAASEEIKFESKVSEDVSPVDASADVEESSE